MALVDSQTGNFGCPTRIWSVSQLSRTRSGEMLHRTIQAIYERCDPGDLTTADDPASLDQIRQMMEKQAGRGARATSDTMRRCLIRR